jgi:hypothetical protein
MPYDAFLATVLLLADRTWEVKVRNNEGGLVIL